MPRKTVLLPLAWVLGAGWVQAEARALVLPDDAAVVRALRDGEAGVGLLDPLVWAAERSAFRPVPRSAVALGPDGTDLVLAGAVRLDGLERVSAPPSHSVANPQAGLDALGPGEEAVVRALLREYYGVEAPPARGGEAEAEVAEEHGRVYAAAAALSGLPHAYVESLSRAWWLLTGTPWVRALAVDAAARPSEEGAEALLRAVAGLLEREAETVAAGLAREHGGEEAGWRALVGALGLAYGKEERRGLGELLRRAARLRLAPRVDDAALPRY